MNHLHRSSLQLLIHFQSKSKNESGYSLVITLASILLLGTLLVTAALISKVDSSSTNASRNSNSGFYAAEAGLNLRANDIRNEFVGFKRPSGNEPDSWEACIDGNSGNNGSDDFICNSSLTINDQKIVTFVNDVTEDSAVAVQIQDGAFAGLNALEYRYDLMSVALNSEGTQESPTSILGMRFKSRLIPIFQFAAFYDDDLTVVYPPTMTLNGRVHSNNDMYLDAGGASGTFTLAITGKVTTPGTLYRGEKEDGYCGLTVSVFDGSNQLALPCGDSNTRRSFTQSDLSGWNNNILTRSDNYKLTLPDMTNFEMPPPGDITNTTKREEEYVYWDKADLRLVLQLDNSNNPSAIQILNADGTENSAATTGLNSCATTSTLLQSEASGDDNYETTDVTLKVNSADSFTEGDFIQIGTDIDSNVIRSKDDSSDTLTLRRQLGHSYQSSTVATKDDTVKKSVVSTSDTFYNFREKNGSTGETAGTFIRMLNVDVRGMMNCINANLGGNALMGSKDLDDDTEGGLVWFLTVQGPDSRNDVLADSPDSPNNYGIRLYNASDLSSNTSGAKNIQGLTVVSDQAVYTQGDYNSNNKKPAAIIADTINVLSNDWSNDDSNGYLYKDCTSPSDATDCNTQITITKVRGESAGCDEFGCYEYRGDDIRDAKSTTVNAAFFAGQDLAGGGNGASFQDNGNTSGGLNNYPRFHEDWADSNHCGGASSYGRCTLTYRGSLVAFGPAQRVNGNFCGSYYTNCNIYTPPIRLWSYDTDFNNAANLPPLTPRVVNVTQEIFERDFTYTSFKTEPHWTTGNSNYFSQSINGGKFTTSFKL